MYVFSDYCACPECHAELTEVHGGLWCDTHSKLYEIRNGIPMLLPQYEDKARQRYLENYNQIAIDDLDTPFEYDRERRHQVLIDFIGYVQGKKVLDIGSSNGIYLRALKADFKVAFDLAYPFLAAMPGASNMQRICGDAESLPFKPGFFDVIIISDILEHLLEPERLVQRLNAICTHETRVIVHVPWQENIAVYQNSKYEFTHLRSFDAYSFAQMWRGRYMIKRKKSTYPDLVQPFVFRLESKLPRLIYNILMLLYYHGRFSKLFYNLEVWRNSWIKEIPKRENWLLKFYEPKFKMFELRHVGSSVFYKNLLSLAYKIENIV